MWDQLNYRFKKIVELLQPFKTVLLNWSPIQKILSPETPLLKKSLYLGMVLTMVTVSTLTIYTVILIPFTPGISDLKKVKIEHPSILLSADGKELLKYRRLNRDWTKLNNISPSVIDALISTEDHRFYEHHGIDFKRTISAVGHTLIGDLQGGSTLTQQLARNLYPDDIGRKATITRKIKEAITALKLEYAYSKKEILESYLNTVPFLYGAYGIEMASRTYFNKSANKLTALEGATLVGMLKGTSYYNPVRNPNRAVERRNIVLSQMVKHGKLTEAKFEALKKSPLSLSFERQTEDIGIAPHFAEYIRRWLVEWADRHDYNIYADGLVIRSTIDTRMQKLANIAVTRQLSALQNVADVEWGLPSERLLSTSVSTYNYAKRRVAPFAYFWKAHPQVLDSFIRESTAYQAAIGSGMNEATALSSLHNNANFIAALQAEKTRLESGLVSIDPRTGYVKAWVGGKDFNIDKYDHVGQAKRQPGSTFKPFVYGAALEQGISPTKQYLDKAIEFKMEDGSVWKPTNFDTPTGRSMEMSEGLIYSKNTITTQVAQEVGARKIVNFAKKMGVTDSSIKAVPSVALGTSAVTLLEMVSSYATIANLGKYHKPIMVTHIYDRQGNVLTKFVSTEEEMMDEKNAKVLVDMMRGVVNRGTGRGVRSMFGIRADIAGKTGTTQNNTDGWFILMHPSLVAGSWIGFNDPRIKIRSDYWGQGSHNALYVVGDFFRQATNNGMIARAAFPKRPADTFLGQIVDDVEAWLQKKDFLTLPDEVKNILPTPQPESPDKSSDEETTPIDIDQIINDVNDTSTFIQGGIKQIQQIQQQLDDGAAVPEERKNNQ